MVTPAPAHHPGEPILAFDSAGRACSAALLAEGKVLAYLSERRSRGQAERLLPLLEELLCEAGMAWDAVRRLAVTRGPGSFTGVRIGLAAARGLALASGRPLFALDCFSLYAAMILEKTTPAARQGRQLLIAIDARRSDLFVQFREFDGRPEQTAAALLPEAVAREAGQDLLLAGDGVAQLTPFLEPGSFEVVPDCDIADPRTLARWAARQMDETASPATPFYLRPPDVTLPKEAQ